MDRCVEVVTRLGDTLLDVRLLPANGCYRVGRAAGVDLASTIARDLPLVDGGVVNVPIGVTATPPPGTHVLVMGEAVELALGLVTVTITLVPRPARVLPRPQGDRRTPAYLGCSLLVHLAAWGLIVTLVAPSVQPTKKHAAVHAHVVPFKTPIDDKPVARTHDPVAPTRGPVAPAASPTTPSVVEAPALAGTSGGVMLAGFGQMMSAVMGHADLNKALADVGPLWREDAWEATQFGGATRRFAPPLTPSETGRYATISRGHAAGDDYDLDEPAPPALAMCQSGACTASGGTDRRVIRDVLADRERAILACYTRAHARGVAEVVVEFQIAPDGSVRHARGHGPSRLATCVADLVSSTAFPSATEATRVRYPVAFRPAA